MLNFCFPPGLTDAEILDRWHDIERNWLTPERPIGPDEFASEREKMQCQCSHKPRPWIAETGEWIEC